MSLFLLSVLAALVCILIVPLVLFRKTSAPTKESKPESPSEKKSKKAAGATTKTPQGSRKKEPPLAEDSWLAGHLRDHTASVRGISFSKDSRWLASVSDDRSFRTWFHATLKEKDHRFWRCNTTLDEPCCCSFSDDGKVLAVAMATTKVVGLYGVLDKKDKEGKTTKLLKEFPTEHKGNIVSLHLCAARKLLLTCADDTEVKLWNVKGELLQTVNTNQMKNNMSSMSDDGRFFAVAAFTGDVKIWEVQYTKEGLFMGCQKVMDLKGHKSKVHSVDFGRNNQKLATASQDNSIIVWNIDVRYSVHEDPKKVAVIPTDFTDHVALSPDAETVAASRGNDIAFFSVESKEELHCIKNAHSDKITCMQWDNEGILLASSSDDRTVKVWANPSKH